MSALLTAPSTDNLERLVRFIRSHSMVAYIVDERILAVTDYGWGLASVDTIEPTLQAVRDWLGY